MRHRDRRDLDLVAGDDGAGAFVDDDACRRVRGDFEHADVADEATPGWCSTLVGNEDVDGAGIDGEGGAGELVVDHLGDGRGPCRNRARAAAS